jgi:hypothetical protein
MPEQTRINLEKINDQAQWRHKKYRKIFVPGIAYLGLSGWSRIVVCNIERTNFAEIGFLIEISLTLCLDRYGQLFALADKIQADNFAVFESIADLRN